MRIVGGTAAGLILKVPKGLEVRPTPDLVKQALFNSWGDRVVGARVLELFAGSGALGLECLSRGAALVTSVEKSRRHAHFIEQNLHQTRLEAQRFELRVQDAFAAVRQMFEAKRKFDAIVADPPYGEKNLGRRSTSFAQQLLDDPLVPGLLEAEGLLILGHTKRDTLSVPPQTWVETKVLRHGDSMIRFFKKVLHPVVSPDPL